MNDEAIDRLIDELVGEQRRLASRRLWACVVLARDLDTCRTLCRCEPVMVGTLEPAAVRRAFRGRQIPEPDAYHAFTLDELDAIAEPGPFAVKP